MSPPGKGEGRRRPDDAPSTSPTTQAQALNLKSGSRIDAGSDNPRDVVTYTVAYGTGYQVGWHHGWAACEDTWQALLGALRPVLDQPRHADLERLRQPSNEPCPTRCGACSRCVRHAAVWQNRRRYGTCDYPGGGL